MSGRNRTGKLRVAMRYAHALMDCCDSPEEAGRALEQLELFFRVWQETPLLRRAAAVPSLPISARRALLDDIGRELSLEPPVASMLALLLSRRRLPEIGLMIEALRRLEAERDNRSEALVESAWPLPQNKRSVLQQSLERFFQKRLDLVFKLSPHLLAGLRVQVGSSVIDGSLQGELSRMSRQITLSAQANSATNKALETKGS